MDANEKEAVLSLVPYFSPERIVFDVGSNKGEWADILINNVDQMQLFEPNIKLIHYTEVKYASLRHIKYNNVAISNKRGKGKFHLYEYEYNGLSSLFRNPEWKGLPHVLHMDMEIDSLDFYGDMFSDISFVKIDVEGTECEVIQGCKNLLKGKHIKFIQFEYSEHYKVPGYTGQQIIDFVKPFGYELYDYNGHWFKADFVENYERKNYYLMADFTEDWNQEFIKNTQFLKGTVNFALEIGCFEGLTTCYICDFLLKPEGRIVCIDPLENAYLTEDIDSDAKLVNKSLQQFKGQYDRFIRNTRSKPVELLRMRSNEAFTEEFKQYKFDLIYIDGDHRETAVYDDAVNSLSVLADGGYILFDDYHGETKRAINKFLEDYSGRVKVISKNYQMMVQNRF